MSDEGKPIYSERGERIGSLHEDSSGSRIYNRRGEKVAELDPEGRPKWVREDWVRVVIGRRKDDC